MNKTIFKNQPVNSRNMTSMEELKFRIDQFRSENILLNDFIYSLPGNIFWKDLNGYYAGCNQNTLALFNLTSTNEFIGKRNIDLVSPEIAGALDKNDQDIFIHKRYHLFEENGLDKHGNPAIYLTQKSPHFNQRRELIGIIGISFDITELKKRAS